MKEKLLKVMKRNQLVEMMYISKAGEITKRRIKVLKVSNDTFESYCFLKQSKRTFIIQNVLALVPIIRKEREVI
ncbi:transcriptional regulator [Ureibacillus sp. Re31]|uniref:Transcriptional regulator n=1 Tax=Ureibacillus galli TaxID=2762222 RepID=A0ABR8XD60_9BACL|nr:transcriptional regulator [Ureibacillus galli]MBD8027150.1 transcriptional regulator [Ureibacillus galli]